ncbi:hypothetical protein AB0J38_07970 [Streptomyces sp. NPDC050095]|uniref:hypothetical protein n=1 Tax=unclassified Streptomyces TaxID=2593676 RepID=UPI00341563B8
MVSGIPEETNILVGREAELRRIDEALGSHRLVTMTGPGGVGKTRVAMRAAAAHRTRYRDGSSWVSLWPLMDGRLLSVTVSDAVGLTDHTSRAPVEALCAWLAGTEKLLASTPASTWSTNAAS